MEEPQIIGFVQLVAGGIAVGFLLLALNNRDARGWRGYLLFTGGIALWMFALGGAKFTSNLFLARGSFHLLLFGVELTAAGWLILALEITDRTTYLRELAYVLGAALLLVQVMAWTNPMHSVMYQIVPEAVRNGRVIDRTALLVYGSGFWAHTAGSYLCGFIAEGILIVDGIRSTGIRRKQFLWLSLAAVPVILASVVSTWGLLQLPYNVSSVGFLLAIPILAAVLFKARFLEIAPVARRTVMAEMDDAMITIDPENRVVDANKRARELFDVGAEYVGMSAAEFFEPIPADVLSPSAETDMDETEVEIPLDGDHRHFSVSISPLSEDTDRGRIVLIHDITAQKRREEALNRKNQRLDEFATIVSHDLRNPLHVAEGFVDVARQSGHVEPLEKVTEAHNRMDSMIDDLLTMARAETIVDDPEAVSLDPLVIDAWQTAETESGTLQREFEDKIINGNPDLLRHVFENLFRNAFDHNDPPVTVRVGLLSDGKGFYVADDGEGIPPDSRGAIFERGHSTSETGTGFGLTIVKDLVQAHDWSITVTESEDGGARFEISNVEIVSTAANSE